MSNSLKHMTTYQRIAAKEKVARMARIHKYYTNHPCCTQREVIAFIPESASLVQQYSKLRTELVYEGDRHEITPEDILEYIYGPNPSRHRTYKPKPKTR